jgi:hypothetical protein
VWPFSSPKIGFISVDGILLRWPEAWDPHDVQLQMARFSVEFLLSQPSSTGARVAVIKAPTGSGKTPVILSAMEWVKQRFPGTMVTVVELARLPYKQGGDGYLRVTLWVTLSRGYPWLPMITFQGYLG